MFYIQRKDENQLETVSECEKLKDAKYELGEYRVSDPSATYYISPRACKAWYEKDKQDA